VTLRHHQQARDASLRANAGSAQAGKTTTSASSPRRNSSGESQDTGHSDPKNWFDQSNKNPIATFDSHAMDVDPPFFQKESDSSTEDKSYPQRLHVPAKLTAAQSSSADEYRSVIDDLTVEIQKLKDELRRYKQKGPDMLRKDKLFEIKVHGLPKRKKRELEATLRDFTAGLEGSPDAGSSSRRNKQSSRQSNSNRIYSGSGSKHASSSSGSNARPADSAYASMSTGAHSSGTSLGKSATSARMNMGEQKVESYLRDIPEGLYPRHVLMTDKEKKKLVVRRLEQLFTGKIGGRHVRRNAAMSASNNLPQSGTLAPTVTDTQSDPQRQMVHQPPNLQQHTQPPSLQHQSTASQPPNFSQLAGLGNEPSREARILPPEQEAGGKKSRSRDNASMSHSGGDQTESGGNGGNSSGGTNTSPTAPPPPEQRPTRLKDLDPDRIQIPSDNMDYIKHLGLVPPELLTEPTEDVHPDADGWVYLNLLCNMAQLHMINVTPDFVRAALSDISTKIQLSPDGRKIRWRGGSEGTRFSSDSSGDGGHNSMEIDTDSSNKDERRKRQKTGHSTGDEVQSGGSSKNQSKFGPQISASSESFHYKPLFVHQDSSNGQTSMDETLSSFGPVEDSNIDDSRWGQSGSGTSLKRKRRHDGAIIYYSGAPFCTDLSGDPGDISPTTYMMSSGQGYQDSLGQFIRPPVRRSESGSFLRYRPLSDRKTSIPAATTKVDIGGPDSPPDLTADSGDESSDIDFNLGWSDDQQFLEVHTLEPCGLGGVLPEDHFMVVVTTKRTRDDYIHPTTNPFTAEEVTDNIVYRLASMSTSSPGPMVSITSKTPMPVVEIEYVSGRIKRLTPVRLPPPAIFFPPFSSDSSMDSDDEYSEEPLDDESMSGEVTSRRANHHHSDDYPDGVDLTSGDEDGEDPDNEPDTHGMYDDEDSINGKRLPALRRQSSAEAAAGTSARGRSKSASADPMGRTGGSSAATAGGPGSVAASSGEMSS